MKKQSCLCHLPWLLFFAGQILCMAHAAAQISELCIEEAYPRPLAGVVRELSVRHGFVITYEDPRWVHESNLVDITDQFEGAAEAFKNGDGPRLLAPKTHSLEFRYQIPDATGAPNDVDTLLDELLAAYSESDNPGEFRWQRSGDVIHVIPATAKDASGKLVMHTSILDMPIELETKERTIMQTLDDVKEEINRVSDAEFAFGMLYIKRFFWETVRIGASGETAREILLQTMTSIDLKTSWAMLYDPVLNRYAFNVYPVREPSAADRSNWSICPKEIEMHKAPAGLNK